MKTQVLAVLLAAGVVAQPAFAKEYQVAMKNTGAAGMMVFEPAFVRANVGDTVRFLPVDKSHNAETILGMVPAGVTPAGGPINAEYVLKLTKPGVYGIRCRPHFGMGMVALVQAGKGPSANLGGARAAKLPPLAAKRMAPLLAAAK